MNFYNKYCNIKVQQNLVDAMNILIKDMAKSKNKNELSFVESLTENSEMLPFLTLNKNTLSMTMKGGADGDESDGDEADDGEYKCADNNIVSVVRNTPRVTTTGIQAITKQIEQVDKLLTKARDENNQEMINSLMSQLQTLSMIETTARQRQQAIDIVNRRENWNMAGDVCNRVTQLVFTGLSGYLSYLVLNLIQNAGSLITGAAGGLLSLFVIIIIDIISKTVNGVTNKLPKILGGGNYMASGRDIVTNMTNAMTDAMREGINETPELNAIVSKLNKLGYTSNIIAFIILFIFFNIISHISRIFMTSNQFSIGLTGISFGQIRTQQSLLDLQVPTTQGTQEAPLIGNVQQQLPILENEEKDEEKDKRGGYKSRKRRCKRKKCKSKKHIKKRNTRKGNKVKRKMRKTRKRKR